MTDVKSSTLAFKAESIDDISEMDYACSIGTTSAQDDVYSRYKFDRTLPDLPICEMVDRILDTIDNHTVVILEGATGCGKTTQVRL